MSQSLFDNLAALDKLDVEGQRVLVRADFDVPRGEGAELALQVDRLLPTLHRLFAMRARVVVTAHALGAPGETPPSLEAAGALLAERLSLDVLLPDEATSDMAHKIVSELRTGQLALLENLAREPGELQNDDACARRLAELCDAFVNEAPSLFDRKLSSLIHLPRLVKAKALGLDSLRVAEGLSRLQRQRERIAILALPNLDQDAVAALEAWLAPARALIVVGAAAQILAHGERAAEPPAGSEVSQESWAHVKSLLARARTQNKQVLCSAGGELGQTLAALGPAPGPGALTLIGPLDQCGVELSLLETLIQGRAQVTAFGFPALLSLYRQPSLLAYVDTTCPSEQVALRALAGGPLPALAAITARV